MYKRYIKRCQYCNIEYSGTKVSKYCTHQCASDNRKLQVIQECQYCKKEYLIQQYRNNTTKFCSKLCKYNFQTNPVIITNCKYCNSVIIRKSHLLTRSKNNFCNHKCANNYNRKENHYLWKNYRLSKSHLKRWAITVKDRDNYKCQYCGEFRKSILEAHHIIPISKDYTKALDLNNGITLCLRCHAKAHETDKTTSNLIISKLKYNECQK